MHNDPDYYEILGLLRTAQSADISAAYHVLARKYHPDVGATDSDSLAKFKMISQAYDVLSDDEKRRAYDQQRQPRSSTHPQAVGGRIVPSQAPWVDFISPLQGAPVGTGDVQADLPISPEESLLGGQCEFTLRIAGLCSECQARPLIAGGICAACQGSGRILEKRQVRVILPRGLRSGSVVRVAGHGKRTKDAVGDLLLRIRIQPYW
jgi:molecular chaperone DnaJ